jgi:hypothetical protein
MKFSPDEDIQNVLAKSATDAQPKAGSENLSLRAQKRVRRNTLCIMFSVLIICGERTDSQTGEIEGET